MKKSSIILTLALIISACLMPLTLNAKDRETFGDVLDELAEIQKQKDDKDNEIAISEAESNRITNEIYKIEKEIEKLSTEIQEANKEINKLEKEIENKKEETDNILVFLQLSNGEKSYLEYIFKAKSFTDLIHRISVVEQLGKYNKEQIKEMNSLIKQNNELKEQNEKNIERQKEKKVESNKKMKELGSRINDLVEDGIGIEEELKAIQNEVDRMKKAGCKNREDKLSVCYPLVTATGFLRPLKTGRVSSEFGWRMLEGELNSHSGIDLAVAEGTPIYPVAAGEIYHIVYRSSCGGNMVYIIHNVKGKKYTSVYMHLLNFGNIKVGQQVSAEDVIGYVGGYTTSAKIFPKTGYDGCSYGEHLHLTISRGHTTAHRSTMFNPREVIEFPPQGRYYWNSRTW